MVVYYVYIYVENRIFSQYSMLGLYNIPTWYSHMGTIYTLNTRIQENTYINRI